MKSKSTQNPKLQSVQPVLMSRDVNRSIRFYERLGFSKVFVDSEDDPKYAGVARDGIELHLQWHDAEEWEYPCDRPTYRFVCAAIDALFKSFVEAGVEDCKRPMVTPWGTYEFHARDPDLNGLQFYCDAEQAQRSG